MEPLALHYISIRMESESKEGVTPVAGLPLIAAIQFISDKREMCFYVIC